MKSISFLRALIVALYCALAAFAVLVATVILSLGG